MCVSLVKLSLQIITFVYPKENINRVFYICKEDGDGKLLGSTFQEQYVKAKPPLGSDQNRLSRRIGVLKFQFVVQRETIKSVLYLEDVPAFRPPRRLGRSDSEKDFEYSIGLHRIYYPRTCYPKS